MLRDCNTVTTDTRRDLDMPRPPFQGGSRLLSLFTTLLPLAAVVVTMGLSARTPLDHSDNIPTADAYNKELLTARFAPTWRITLRHQYAALDWKRQALLETQDPAKATLLRHDYTRATVLYNAIAKIAPPQAFVGLRQPRCITSAYP